MSETESFSAAVLRASTHSMRRHRLLLGVVALLVGFQVAEATILHSCRRDATELRIRVTELEHLMRDVPRATSDGTVRARRLVIGGP